MILNKDEKVLNSDIFGEKKIDDIIGHTDDEHCNGDETVSRKEWLKSNIPFIETPDKLIDRIYYFRWNNLLSCLCKRSCDGKYEFDESSELGSRTASYQGAIRGLFYSLKAQPLSPFRPSGNTPIGHRPRR